VVTTRTTADTTEATATGRHSLSPSAGRLGPEAAGAYIGELFAEHGQMVLGLSRLLLRDPVEAEDAAQQVFLSAQQAVLRGSLPRDPPAWIAAITRNECRARVRARMREPLTLPELPSDLPDPLASAIRAADLQAIWVALAALPRRQRRALMLRELGGLSYHELGRALGMSHSAVESLLFRARQRLRVLLAGANARFAAFPVAWKVAGAASVSASSRPARAVCIRFACPCRSRLRRCRLLSRATLRRASLPHVRRGSAARLPCTSIRLRASSCATAAMSPSTQSMSRRPRRPSRSKSTSTGRARDPALRQPSPHSWRRATRGRGPATW
jgi:RNA polymerase sigma factor (sigma-70 family)